MNDNRELILSSIRRILKDAVTGTVDRRPRSDEWPQTLWHPLETNGFTRVGSDGLEWPDALAVLEACGEESRAGFLADIYLAGYFLTKAGLSTPGGPVTWGISSDGQILPTKTGVMVTGRWARIPWGRYAETVILLALCEEGLWVCSVPAESLRWRPGTNMAGEPRDDLLVDRLPLSESSCGILEGWGPHPVKALAALTRVMLISGGLKRALSETVQHATQRVQFGRPIAQFQAIRQELAVLAGEVAASQAVTGSVLDAIEKSRAEWPVMAAMAKIRAGRAVETTTKIAHQIHGATAFTDEHPLGILSPFLWSWRHEYGSDKEWARFLASQHVMASGSDVWDLVTL